MSDGTVLTEEASANVATSLETINTGHTYEYAGTVYSLYIYMFESRIVFALER